MFFIGYIVKKPEYNIDSVNPLYLVIKSLEGHIEKKNGTDDRNLVITSDSGKSRLDALWKDIEDEISDLLKKDCVKIKFGPGSETTSIVDEYKIRFDSNTDLPLGTPMISHALTLVIRSVIEKGNKFYPQIYLEDALFGDNL